MQINHVGSKCTLDVVLQSKILTLLFIAIGLPLNAASPEHDTFNAPVNDSSIELEKHLRKYSCPCILWGQASFNKEITSTFKQ